MSKNKIGWRGQKLGYQDVVETASELEKKVLIVCALEKETQGQLDDYEVLYTGVGKVNATYALATHFGKYGSYIPYDLVINYGTAGSRKHSIGELVDCTKFIQRDMDVSVLGFEKYETPFEDYVSKKIDFSTFANNPINCLLTCATGDSFMNSDDSHVGDVVDMESYALAKVCLKFDISFIAFKYISDSADKDASNDWAKNLKKGQKLFKKTVLDLLDLY